MLYFLNKKCPLKGKTMDKKHILVLDDEPELINFLSDCLDSYEVKQCTKTDEAIDELKNSPEKYFGCIIDNDIDEVGGGVRFAKTIKSLKIVTTIVMFTGKPLQKEEEAVIRNTVDRLEKKPVSVKTIRTIFP